MSIILSILSNLLHYTIEVLPSLAAGFLISGIVHEFVPTGLVEKHPGGKGIIRYDGGDNFSHLLHRFTFGGPEPA